MAFKSLGQAVYYLYLPLEGGRDIKRGRYYTSDDTDLNQYITAKIPVPMYNVQTRGFFFFIAAFIPVF